MAVALMTISREEQERQDREDERRWVLKRQDDRDTLVRLTTQMDQVLGGITDLKKGQREIEDRQGQYLLRNDFEVSQAGVLKAMDKMTDTITHIVSDRIDPLWAFYQEFKGFRSAMIALGSVLTVLIAGLGLWVAILTLKH